jgi:hypothetical protein
MVRRIHSNLLDVYRPLKRHFREVWGQSISDASHELRIGIRPFFFAFLARSNGLSAAVALH